MNKIVNITNLFDKKNMINAILIYSVICMTLFLSCTQVKTQKKRLSLEQADVEKIEEQSKMMIIIDEEHLKDEELEAELQKEMILNGMSYDMKGCVEYFNKLRAEGFSSCDSIDEKGRLVFNENMKDFHIRLGRREIDLFNNSGIDSIIGVVIYEKQKITMQTDTYMVSQDSSKESISRRRVVVWYYNK